MICQSLSVPKTSKISPNFYSPLNPTSIVLLSLHHHRLLNGQFKLFLIDARDSTIFPYQLM